MLSLKRSNHVLKCSKMLCMKRSNHVLKCSFCLWVRHSCSHLFVGGLSYDTNEPILKKAFEEHGEIIEVNVICDHVDGRSKGYGFVHYADEMAASKALKEMDGKVVDGRNIRVYYARRGGTPGNQGVNQCPVDTSGNS